MRMFVERTEMSAALPFDLPELKMHLRVDHPEEDGAITRMGRAAASEVEQYSQVALLQQSVSVTVLAPDLADGIMRLPVGPVLPGAEMTISLDGVPFEDFTLLGSYRPAIYWQDDLNGLSPHQMIISYRAGFGETASDIPADLMQAILDQAALHYDGRSPMDAKSLASSPHMLRIGARYRGVSL